MASDGKTNGTDATEEECLWDELDELDEFDEATQNLSDEEAAFPSAMAAAAGYLHGGPVGAVAASIASAGTFFPVPEPDDDPPMETSSPRPDHELPRQIDYARNMTDADDMSGLFAQVELWAKENDWEKIDILLSALNPSSANLALCTALAMQTGAMSERLSARRQFCESVRKEVIKSQDK